jgi:hypothetical protein
MADMHPMCLTPVMDQRRSLIAALAVALALALLSGCTSPTSDPVKLRAIENEARSLMAHHPITPPGDRAEVPMSRLPSAIAGLRPQSVTVYHWGVDIMVKPYFDGGWGYEVPRNKQGLPMPANCYSEPYPGVFWHGPC